MLMEANLGKHSRQINPLDLIAEFCHMRATRPYFIVQKRYHKRRVTGSCDECRKRCFFAGGRILSYARHCLSTSAYFQPVDLRL